MSSNMSLWLATITLSLVAGTAHAQDTKPPDWQKDWQNVQDEGLQVFKRNYERLKDELRPNDESSPNKEEDVAKIWHKLKTLCRDPNIATRKPEDVAKQLGKSEGKPEQGSVLAYLEANMKPLLPGLLWAGGAVLGVYGREVYGVHALEEQIGPGLFDGVTICNSHDSPDDKADNNNASVNSPTPAPDPDKLVSKPLWKEISQLYAQKLTGDIHVFLRHVDPESIFALVEWPTLRSSISSSKAKLIYHAFCPPYGTAQEVKLDEKNQLVPVHGRDSSTTKFAEARAIIAACKKGMAWARPEVMNEDTKTKEGYPQ